VHSLDDEVRELFDEPDRGIREDDEEEERKRRLTEDSNSELRHAPNV
jgi:hypothetical protein